LRHDLILREKAATILTGGKILSTLVGKIFWLTFLLSAIVSWQRSRVRRFTLVLVELSAETLLGIRHPGQQFDRDLEFPIA
jgi:hypothetical protein